MDTDYYPDIPKCPKCGSVNIRPYYDTVLDLVQHRCGCGYSWNTLPLDRTPKKGPKKCAKP